MGKYIFCLSIFIISVFSIEAQESKNSDSIIGSFAGKTNNELITKEALLSDPSLKISGINESKILSFEITVAIEGYEKTATSKSEKTTEDQIRLLESLQSGSKVYIENIIVSANDGSTRNLPPIALKIN
jgi:hypothetical protein